MSEPINRLAMFSAPAEQVNMLAQPQLPAGHPANMLMAVRDWIPQVQADDTSLMSGIMSRLGRTATAIPRAGLETMANWLQGTHDPNAVRIGEDTIAPLGLFGMAGLAGRGAAVRAMADNAKSSAPGVVAQGLDMSQDARLARAQEMGFRTNMPLYHGTAANFDAFDLSRGGATSRSDVGQVGVSVARNPEVANEFAELAARRTHGDPSVLPLLHRAERPARITLDGSETNLEVAATLREAWDRGYDAVLLKNYTTPGGRTGEDIIIVKDPSQLRSPQAAFDPAQRSSANLLAADNAKSSVPGTVVNAMGEAGARTPRSIGDEFLAMGTDQAKFKPALDNLKLSKAEWDELANYYRNAPTNGTFQFKFKNIDEAKRFIWRTFIERHAAESKAARINEMFGEKAWAGAMKSGGDVQSSPYASAPGLAANSTQQDDGVMGILRRYGLID